MQLMQEKSHKINAEFDDVAFDPNPEKHIKLAFKMAAWCAAHRREECGTTSEDWLGLCGEVLMRCVACFDPTKKIRFSTYYCRAVQNEFIRRDDMGRRKHVRIEFVLSVDDDGNTVKTRTKTWRKNAPTPISDDIGWRGKPWRVSGPEQPLDELVRREDEEDRHNRLASVLDRIEDMREYDMVRRGACGVSYDKMAKDYGLTRERARQILINAIGSEAVGRLAKVKRPVTRQSMVKRAYEERKRAARASA